MRRIFSLLTLLVGSIVCSASAYAQGSISGTLSSGGNPAGGFVDLVRATDTGSIYSQTIANPATGEYAFGNVPDGTYYVQTQFATQTGVSLIDEVYNDLVCYTPSFCPFANANIITISGGNAVTGINFALDPAGSISGTVSGPSGPLPSAFLTLFNPARQTLTTRSSGSTGTYTFSNLPSGTYYVTAANGVGLVDEIFNDVVCPGATCALSTGTPIEITAPAAATNIDFTLAQGSRVSGTVTDQNGIPLSGGVVIFYNTAGVGVAGGSSDAAGVYQSAGGLPAGTYYARVFAGAAPYFDMVYPELPCNGTQCIPTNGLGIVVDGVNPVPNIGFRLYPIPTTTSAPDLTSSWRSLRRNGSDYELKVRIKNQGRTNAGRFQVQLYQSTDNIIATGDRLSKRINVSSLKRGKTTELTMKFRKRRGNQYIILSLDHSNKVIETNESNNKRARRF